MGGVQSDNSNNLLSTLQNNEQLENFLNSEKNNQHLGELLTFIGNHKDTLIKLAPLMLTLLKRFGSKRSKKVKFNKRRSKKVNKRRSKRLKDINNKIIK